MRDRWSIRSFDTLDSSIPPLFRLEPRWSRESRKTKDNRRYQSRRSVPAAQLAMSLSVAYTSGKTYPLLTTVPSIPSLTPNASCTSSYSLSSSSSLATCSSATAGSPDDEKEGTEEPSRRVISRASSQPGLRHMPSRRSLVSHVSHISHNSYKSRGSLHSEIDPLELDLSSDEGVLYGAAPQHGAPSPRKTGRGQASHGRITGCGPGLSLAPETRSSRKGSSGSSDFAQALKKINLGSSGRHAEYQHCETTLPRQMVDDDGGDRVERPFDAPNMANKRSAAGRGEKLSSQSSSSHDSADPSELDDFFFSLMPAHSTFPCVINNQRGWRRSGSAAPPPIPAREISDLAFGDAQVGFDLDIFSPRVSKAPVLRGIIDSLPVSPLQLSNPRESVMTLVDNRQCPSSAKPTTPTSSSICKAEEWPMPAPRQGASDWNRPNGNIGISGNTSRSSVRPPPVLYRLPRASYPCSAGPPSIFPPSNSSTLPFTRRHSAIIRPPILPTPTPPSLIVSPRSLGTPLIPPGPTSPSRLDTIAGLPPASLVASTVAVGRRVSDRVRRHSIVVRVGDVPPTGGLGMGPISEVKNGFRPKRSKETTSLSAAAIKTRAPTPATFGLDGEAEIRLVAEGDESYYA